jgi:hypothetical protein
MRAERVAGENFLNAEEVNSMEQQQKYGSGLFFH